MGNLLISLFLFALNVFSIFTLKVEKHKCKEPLNIYANLECDPVYGHGRHGVCPDYFDCSQIDPKINKCYYEGKYYAIGEHIDETEKLPICYAFCECQNDLTFMCAVYDCYWPEIPDGCYFTYAVNGCCPTGYKCPNNETLICHAGGYDNYEGQIFRNPKDLCSNCVCAEGVTGNPGDPHCEKYVCDVEISQSNLILAYCAAVYANRSNCCPMEYICPRDDDIWLDFCDDSSDSSSDSSSTSSTSELHHGHGHGHGRPKCRYGKRYYDIGSRFLRREKVEGTEEDLYIDINCECKISPYFTCIKDFNAHP